MASNIKVHNNNPLVLSEEVMSNLKTEFYLKQQEDVGINSVDVDGFTVTRHFGGELEDVHKAAERVAELQNIGVNVTRLQAWEFDRGIREGEENRKEFAGMCFFIEEQRQGVPMFNLSKMDDSKCAAADVREFDTKYIAGQFQMIADAPIEHYEKYVKDLIAIQKAGLHIHDNESGNMRYDKDTGFWISGVRDFSGFDDTMPVGTKQHFLARQCYYPFYNTILENVEKKENLFNKD